jgi:putative SOS response-associated peptidase YedK
MILLLGIEIFSIIPEEQVSLIFWVIRHLDAFYSSELPQRSLDALQWGLIPYCAKDPKMAYKTINARLETVDTPRIGRHSRNGAA